MAVKDAPIRAGEAFVSPAAARKLGAPVTPAGVLIATDRMPTQAEVDRAQGVVDAAGTDAWLTVERGYRTDYGLGLLALAAGAAVVTLGAVGIATGLAAADGRPDLATLGAVGASPGVRRRLAMAQAATIAVLGTALGVAAGFVPGIAAVRTRSVPTELAGGETDYIAQMALVIPWPTLVIVAIGVPLLAVLATGLLTRSRLPLVRRIG